jgi:hypothetical protein
VLSRESAYNVVKGYIEELDEWEDDTSGVGEKLKIEREEAEDVAATAAGRKVAGQTRLVPPPLEGEGAPVLPPLET